MFKYFIFNILWYFNKTQAVRFIGVVVGQNTRIYTKNFGSEPFLIKIGDNCTITSECSFITHNGALSLIKSKNGERLYHYQRIEVGNNVFVGYRSIILQGVKIGDNVIIGAGSCVTKSIPSNTVVAGNPAKYISSFNDFRDKILLNNHIIDTQIYFQEKNYYSKINKMLDSSNKDEIKK